MSWWRKLPTGSKKKKEKTRNTKKEIIANKEKANFFANKGGKMRLVARKMRNKAAEMEEAKVDVRKEDKAIRNFTIPCQEELSGEILKISSLTVMKNLSRKKKTPKFRSKKTIICCSPVRTESAKLLYSNRWPPERRRARRSQKASGWDTIARIFRRSILRIRCMIRSRPRCKPTDEEKLRSVAAGFLIDKTMIGAKIGALSEGQKGLVAFARLVLEEPGLLILDEPTNHINFRHLPVIAKALDGYKGAMVLVSHVPEFVEQIRIDETLDLEK